MSYWPDIPELIDSRFVDITVVAETGSTNADLLAAAADGAAEGTVLVTDHQTAGRGRQARSWHDVPGSSLLVSVLIRPRPEYAPLLPLLAGLAVVDGLSPLAEADDQRLETPLGLKWPNDVLAPGLGERKVAGTLCESTASGGSMAVVIGTGVNLWWAESPPAAVVDTAATATEAIGRRIERDVALDRYLRAMEYWLRLLESPDQVGRQAVLDRYRSHCLTIGRRVRFEVAGQHHVGVVGGVADAGTLLFETDDGHSMELHAGDAHHLPL